MNLPRWISLNQRRCRMEHLQEPSPTRAPLQFRNVTRQTVVASCVNVANTGVHRRKGLLGREGLHPGEGLWITPCEAVHTIGMRFSIDLIYLDRNLRVKKVRNRVPPWRLSACFFAHSVLELSPGTVLETGTRPGDRLEVSSVVLSNAFGQGNLFPEEIEIQRD